jgi:hypothetical protein
MVARAKNRAEFSLKEKGAAMQSLTTQSSTTQCPTKLLSIILAGGMTLSAITPHEFAMRTLGMTATPAPVTAESTDAGTYQMPARPFVLILRST